MFSRSPTLKKLGEEGQHLISTYAKHRAKFSQDEQKRVERLFLELDEKASQKDVEGAEKLVDQLSKLISARVPSKGFRRSFDWIIALAIALFVATIVRQLVFELYEIPSGSMRPTFREGDHLAVSKTTFGINTPFSPEHLFFSPDRVLRGGVVTFIGEGVDLSDTDTKYFWLFPGKKRYIKRLIGKPEDTLTFYGGLIYGVDKNGEPIKELLEPPFQTIDHVPFNSFDQKHIVKGAIARGGEGEILYSFFNLPLGKIAVSASGVRGEVYDGTRWIREKPSSEPHEGIQSLMDWFGMGGFGQARITADNKLEIIHHAYLAPYERPGMPPSLGHLPVHHSFLPLDSDLLQTLAKHLYTARFTMKNGVAYRLGADEGGILLGNNIPDGTYEFYHGEPIEILFTGIPKTLGEDHPLRHLTESQVKTLFNLGIEFHPYYEATGQFPSRYAYFREGSLYVMGAPLLLKGDPRLEAFNEIEKSKKIPFADPGVPSKEKILATGLKIPKNHYLVLGDNYAMSSDARSFGTIPAGNLEGSPSFIFWPPGDRMGAASGASYPWWNPYTAAMWALFTLGIIAFIRYERRKRAFPLSPRYLKAN